MGTTPNGIPYPDGGDIPDISFYMQQQAEAVDAAMLRAYYNDAAAITVLAGTLGSQGARAIVSVDNDGRGTVTLNAQLIGVPYNASTIATLGTGIPRPTETSPWTGSTTSPNGIFSGYITNGGDIVLSYTNHGSGTPNCWLAVTYGCLP